MSILIRGMEMPIEKSRIIQIYPDGTVRRLDGSIFNSHFEAVPVPPHGELIDRDALADDFRGFIATYDGCPFSQLSIPDKARRDELQAVLAEVINAPTIIPAEEGET